MNPYLKRVEATFAPRPTPWQERAACAGRADLFEEADRQLEHPGRPQHDGTRSHRPAVAAAISVCRSCPVLAACLRDSASTEGFTLGGQFSIRAGLTPTQRRVHNRKAAE